MSARVTPNAFRGISSIILLYSHPSGDNPSPSGLRLADDEEFCLRVV